MPDAPAAPPAPPAAPAAPTSPVPAPAPAPSAPAPSPESGASDDPIRAFDQKLTEAFDKAAPMAKKPDAPTKPAEPAKPEAPKPEPTKQTAPIKVPKELRAELDRVSGELTAKNKQITDMEAKIRDYEAKGKDTTTLTERLGTLEKDMEALRAENRALKQETSPEFKAKYEEPFIKAADYAKRVIEQLTVTNPETGETRPAKFDDFREIYNLPYNKAIAKAKEMFGDGFQLVINHMTELQRLEYTRNQALEEEKSNWKQREEADKAKHIQQQEEVGKLYGQTVKELGENIDDYHDDPTDKELTAAREEGFKLFDSKTSNVQQRIIKNAHIKHRFAAYGPMKLKLLRQNKQIEELKAELETYKTSPPDPGRRKGGKEGSSDTGLTWEEAARKELS